MPGLRYADAVKLLGGDGPLGTLADNLLGGALSVATAGGSEVALSLFDAKGEVVRLGRLVAAQINDTVRGLKRYDRTKRLHAAHGVLVVAAFFEALDEALVTAGMESPAFTRDDQILLVTTETGGDWPRRLLAGEIPGPAPDRGYHRLVTDLEQWFGVLAGRLADHLTGLAVWDGADERTRRAVADHLRRRLPGRAVERYEETFRRLAVDLPEFAIWMHQLDARASGHGLQSLEAALARATSHRTPDRHRAALSAAYRTELDRPILGGDAGHLVMPTLARAYVDSRFRVKAAGPGARPAEDEWWDVEARGDLAGFLGTYLTTPQAADAPMLLLGQPGAGKSSLTRILAARLPAADYLVVRVALREVRAEAEIQDQVEQALRGAIGETVAWADLARDAGAAMPVILLDGFDELLQATGIHQSDYLHRVAVFQQREATLGRPVAVVVTSRVAVADRARLPAGGLAVRLEPFDEPQLAQWLATWNGVNAAPGWRPLPLEVLRRFPDLAAQPLLLLMLALYDAGRGTLQDADSTFDSGQLFERLLGEFAAREVLRVHSGQPDSAMPALVEHELLRLSVVAFAMFHRLRLWVTTDELDRDLAGLGLRPSAAGTTEAFRTPVTAGQEMVGRFFFIQRAQARQDDQTLRTYEFLHATFGEYLVARLVVQAVRDAAARARARTLQLGPAGDDDLLQSLLGFTPLTARTTVLPFITSLLQPAQQIQPAQQEHPSASGVREWLVERLRAAVTRPQYTPRVYQPVDKRIDYWMATYSFNLMLLTLACGGTLHAGDLFSEAGDPADQLRQTALQWRAAVPGGMWMSALEPMAITREWLGDGRRDLALRVAPEEPLEGVEPYWSHGMAPGTEMRRWHPGSGYAGYFPLEPALKSMHLTDGLSDDAVRHALEPLLDRLPSTVGGFVVRSPDSSESVAHSLLRLWLASTLADGPDDLRHAYERAVFAVIGYSWGPEQNPATPPAIAMVLRSLVHDADRLPPDFTMSLIIAVFESEFFDEPAHLGLIVDGTLAAAARVADRPEADRMIAAIHDRLTPSTLTPSTLAPSTAEGDHRSRQSILEAKSRLAGYRPS